MAIDTIGQRIHEVRKSRHITSDLLAEMSSLSTGSYVRQLERGEKLPSISSLINICKALEVTPDYLLANEIKTIKSVSIGKLTCDKLARLTPYQLECVQLLIDKFIEQNSRDSVD